MKKLLIISGQTATGKTDLGIYLARRFNGEIISFDSRQAYQRLDIITGKILTPASPKRQRGEQIKDKIFSIYKTDDIAIWLYDVIDPKQYLTVYEFCQMAEVVIENIVKRGKLPIIVGGTVFYIKSFLEGFESAGIAPDWDLRVRLEKLTVVQLQQKLIAVDGERFLKMNLADRKNKRRLVRAIEISTPTKKSLSGSDYPKLPNSFDVLFLALILDKERLKTKIEQRIEARMQQGAVEEIKSLQRQGYQFDDPGLNTIGYKELRAYIEGRSSLAEAVERWAISERQYAKRQLVFLKKMPDVRFFNPEAKNLLENVQQLVYKWHNAPEN